ncbi:MAG TPA: hypothetical protein VJ697_11370 [Nitrososphaeraceae archaeon]|nr:hypothetical protein [Nitrososphaeraceae archaeon]
MVKKMPFYDNNNLDDQDDYQSIYTDEEYEQLTEGKYGKEIFVPDNEIDLELSETLENEGIIEKFIIDLRERSVKLILNRTYEPTVSISVSIDIIKNKKDGRKLLLNEFKNELKNLRVEHGHILLIQSTLNKNFELLCNNSTSITEDETKNDVTIEFESSVQKLLKENLDISFEEWSAKLLEKRHLLNEKVNEYFPSMQLLLDFELAIKTILNIQDITLPFMGIVFAAPSSLKTAFFKFLRKLRYSYFTDKFTARAFVSHSANVAKEKLEKIDMLPQIKDKILLTPELSTLFSGKDDDVREQFGIITRVLDGEGLETNSGVHGKREYYGEYMFTWLGAAVDIPYSVYKFLSTIGFKIYFLRLHRIEVSEDDLLNQLTSKKDFSEKMKEVDRLLFDYLTWFEVCPISVGESNNGRAKIEWDNDNDDKEIIRIIARLALLLAHLRGHVDVL